MTRCLGAVILALTVATTGAEASRPRTSPERPGPTPERRSPEPERRAMWLTGQFLVATEQLKDPHFDRTVIYMVRHDAGGAMGLVVNRALAELPAARVLEQFGLDSAGATGSLRVHYGGPVQPQRGFVLHTSEYTGEGSQLVRDGIVLTMERGILGAIARGKGPQRSLLAFGYAGWAPGQLEREIRSGAWIAVPVDQALLFDVDVDQKWERAMARRRIDL